MKEELIIPIIMITHKKNSLYYTSCIIRLDRNNAILGRGQMMDEIASRFPTVF